jgi:hypothetical protein
MPAIRTPRAFILPRNNTKLGLPTGAKAPVGKNRHKGMYMGSSLQEDEG